jgi:hypothetical protein
MCTQQHRQQWLLAEQPACRPTFKNKSEFTFTCRILARWLDWHVAYIAAYMSYNNLLC